MPNIEIHGYGESPCCSGCYNPVSVYSDAFKIKREIDSVISKLGLEKEAITTIIPSIAQTCDGKNDPAPFLRIFNTNTETGLLIAGALHAAKIFIDVEISVLSCFIPKKG